MRKNNVEKHQKAASRLTLCCLLSFLIGGGITWGVAKGGGPEALGAIIPMIVTGAIHFFGGPAAIY